MEKKQLVPNIEPIATRVTSKKKVHQYDLSGKYIKTFDSIADAQRAMNPRGLSVYKAVNGMLKSAYGFQWRKMD